MSQFTITKRRGPPLLGRVNHRLGFTVLELSVVLLILVMTAGVVIPLTRNISATADIDVTRSQLVELRKALTQYWIDVKYASTGTSGVTVFEYANTDAINGGMQNVLSTRCLFSNPDLDRDGGPVGDIALYDSRTKIGWNGPYLLNTPAIFPGELTSRADFMHYAYPNDLAFFDVISRNLDSTSRRVPLPIVVQAQLSADGQTIDVRVVSAGEDGTININPLASNHDIMSGTQSVGDDLYEMFTLRP